MNLTASFRTPPSSFLFLYVSRSPKRVRSGVPRPFGLPHLLLQGLGQCLRGLASGRNGRRRGREAAGESGTRASALVGAGLSRPLWTAPTAPPSLTRHVKGLLTSASARHPSLKPAKRPGPKSDAHALQEGERPLTRRPRRVTGDYPGSRTRTKGFLVVESTFGDEDGRPRPTERER